ncbi:glycerol kinase GlpK [Halobacteriovorax sp. XZX-3]|uniref:glycerol kinase GlpK n=1 Tax=unclassified Halobacteriovorax TaxID=2639665 RepID=UPI003717416A
MYILSLDQGTTGTTATIIDAKTFKFVDKENQEFKQYFPNTGWVEHDLDEIWKSVKSTVQTVLKRNNIDPNNISSIGITNQRETTCAFNRKGEALAKAIVWQDRRTADFCDSMKTHEDSFKKITGLPLDPYFSGTKIHWLLNNNQYVKEAHKNHDLRFGTIDTFLLYRLTNGDSFKTDVSNASRTLLMSLDTCDWDINLCEILGVDKNDLPEICESICDFGTTKGLDFLPDGISINGILGDQQAALFGQACFTKGTGKCTYGTGAFMLVNTGEEKKYSEHGLLTTVAYKYQGKIYYALEGSCYIAGACVQWLRDNLQIIDNAAQTEDKANAVKDLNQIRDLILLPFFTGIGSPYWKPHAKAALIGMTRATDTNDICRAALEGIALSINDLIKAMKSDMGSNLEEFKVDGGAVANNLLMQIQADISGVNVTRPKVIETTSYGAALAAAIGAGLMTIDDVSKQWEKESFFESSSANSEYFDYKKKLWDKYIQINF